MRGEERPHVIGNPERPVRPARHRRYVCGELPVRNPDAGVEVRGNGVEQRGDDSRFPTVQPFEAVDAHVGRAELRSLNPVADTPVGMRAPGRRPGGSAARRSPALQRSHGGTSPPPDSSRP